MTRLRQIAMAGLAAIAIGGVASSASAMETGTFQNRLNGATIGLPLGAAPPPGLYTGLETAYLGMIGNNSGHSTGNQCAAVPGGGCAALPALAQAVPLLWVPGWNWLIGLAALILPRLCKPSTCSTRAAQLARTAIAAAPFRSPPAALCIPTLSSNRSTFRGNWEGDGSFPRRSPSRLRMAPTNKARRTQAIGRSSRLLPSRIWAIIGSRRRTSSMISTPGPRAPAALPGLEQ